MAILSLFSKLYIQHKKRWVVFTISFAFGALLYFYLPFEPHLLGILIYFFGFALALLAVRRLFVKFPKMLFYYIFLPLLCGFSYTQIYSHIIKNSEPPALLGYQNIQGELRNIERSNKGYKIFIRPHILGDAPYQANGWQYRIRLYEKQMPALKPKIGDIVQIATYLQKSEGAKVPEGLDFKKYLWFKKIMATGYALGNLHIIQNSNENNNIKSDYSIITYAKNHSQNMRQYITDKIEESLKNSPHQLGIASALLTGEKGRIDTEIYDDFRKSARRIRF